MSINLKKKCAIPNTHMKNTRLIKNKPPLSKKNAAGKVVRVALYTKVYNGVAAIGVRDSTDDVREKTFPENKKMFYKSLILFKF